MQNTKSNKNKKEQKKSEVQTSDVIIYSDGSCTPNPGLAGWAAVLIHSKTGKTKEISGGFKLSTISRMEITAVINALKNLTRDNLTITVYSDSKYVVDSVMKRWVYSWESENFKKRVNSDLWIEMLKEIKRQKNIEFKWVKGHSGVEFNERCDVLASTASHKPNLPEDKGYISPQPIVENTLFQEPVVSEPKKIVQKIPKKEKIYVEKIGASGFALRKYQVHSINRMEHFLKNTKKDKGVFVLPTGAGKSIIIAELASMFPDKYFINVTTSKELIKQNYEKFTAYGLEASLLSASLNKKEKGRITFSTIGTLIKEVKYFKDKEVVVVFDEAHISSQRYSQFDMFLKQLKNVKTIGLTATPFRLSNTISGSSLKMMNRDRNCMYKTIEEVVQIQDMVEAGYWSPLIYNVKDMDESSLKLNSTGTEYTESSIDEFVDLNELFSKIKEAVDTHKDTRRSILVSVPSIKAAEDLSKLIPDSQFLHSKMSGKNRDKVISDFKSFKTQVLIQVRILTVGFDFPELDCIIMGTPSNSLVFFYQYCGRGIRIHKDKKDCLIIDFSGNTKRFGKIEDLKIIDSPLTKGWAVIGTDEKVLTGYGLIGKYPTLAELEKKQGLQNSNTFLSRTGDFDASFTFGKYMGCKASQVVKDDFRYVKWLLENEEFQWKGEALSNLKKSLFFYVEKFCLLKN